MPDAGWIGFTVACRVITILLLPDSSASMNQPAENERYTVCVAYIANDDPEEVRHSEKRLDAHFSDVTIGRMNESSSDD